MTKPALSTFALLLALVAIACTHTVRQPAASLNAGVVHVAPPTGERETDRASILDALERVEPGGTVQFAAGTYRVGEIIPVTVPRVTLLGHAEGTVLRGCDPDGFAEYPGATSACNGFELTGGNQTVRNLTFEYAWYGLYVGCCRAFDDLEMETFLAGGRREPSVTGGYLIEGNTFRNSVNEMRFVGESDEPSVIRNNRFVNTYHAVPINGRTVHLLDNDISVPEPELVPFSGHPGGAIAVSPFQFSDDPTSCAGNIVARNRLEGHPDGIAIFTLGRGTACRDNVIRDNTVQVSRPRVARSSEWLRVVDPSDSTVVGVPITLLRLQAIPGHTIQPGQEPVLESNVVENNRIMGADGVGIELIGASRNRIAGNTITGIRAREPFPGNLLGPPPSWRDANGAGIWISPGSAGNEILGNVFEDVASDAIVIEGDRNRVEIRNANDAVRDLGNGNRVTAPGAARSHR